MAMAALRLRRHHLLVDPTRFLFTRIEPQIHPIRSAAAASLPSQRPTYFGSSIHPHRTPSPCSTPSAAPPSLCSTPSAASTDSHRTPSPRPIHFVPSSVDHQRCSAPRSTLPAFALGHHCHSAEEQCDKGLLAALEAGPRALPRGRKASSHSMGNQAARRILSAANPCLPHVSPSQRLLGSSPKRSFSTTPGSTEVPQRQRLPPVSQLVFRDDPQVMEVEWIDPIDHLKKHSLVVDARNNHLNLEIPGFGEQPRYNYSEDTGMPLFQSLVFLALINNNRGYCIKKSFRKVNLLLCPKLKQFRFKEVDFDDLNPNSKDFNRAATYLAAAILMRELLYDTVGPHAVACLLAEPRDLLSKMERPSDEPLITYHASLLSTDGRICFYLKLYRLFFKIFPFSKDEPLKKLALEALGDLAYTSPMEKSIEDIIKEHPLLAHIDSKRPTGDTEIDATLETISSTTAGNYAEAEENKESRRLGKIVVALPRHAIEYAFDKEARQVQSKFSIEAKSKRLWRCSLYEVVDLLRSSLPLHLLKAQEAFVRTGLWDFLEIDNFWARDLTWMGGVPTLTKDERDSIKPSYGKRRQQARKFDRFNRGTRPDTNKGDQAKEE